jgi:hypothetical protein
MLRRVNEVESFLGAPTVRVETTAGEVDLPIKYRDAQALTLFWSVSVAEAERALSGTGLCPVRIRPGRAALALTFFEYRDTTIGPYNELSVALLVSPGRGSPLGLLRLLAGDRALGAHVLHLPVTTNVARAGGVELYGYPKFVAEIPIEVSGGKLHAELVHEGRRVLALDAPLPSGRGVPMPDLVTYSLLDGYLMRTRVRTHCSAIPSRGRGVRLELSDLDHPVARTLRGFGLPAEPSLALLSDPFRSLLPLPESLRAVPGSRAAA